jgi:hypothetical protein
MNKIKNVSRARQELIALIEKAGGDDYDIERLFYLTPPSRLPKDRAAFTVKIELIRMHGTLVQKLSRGDGSYRAPPGRYACFPLWDGGDLLPEEVPQVTLPQELIKQVLETFTTGIIPEGLEAGLRKVLTS